jgi:hypothetical protein
MNAIFFVGIYPFIAFVYGIRDAGVLCARPHAQNPRIPNKILCGEAADTPSKTRPLPGML